MNFNLFVFIKAHLKSIFNDHIIKFTEYVPNILQNEYNSNDLSPGEVNFDKRNQILTIKCKVISF